MSLKNGITALPISTSKPTQITLSSSSLVSASSASIQQPQTHPIAHYNSKPHPNPTSSLLDANSSYILYSVKNGLVRVIDCSPKSNLRTLLRGHTRRISDVSFFNKQSSSNDVVGTVAGREDLTNDLNGGSGAGDGSANATGNGNGNGNGNDDDTTMANVLIWRIFKNEDELRSEKLLEIRLRDAMRIVWHPFNANQFVLLHDHKSSTSRSTTSTTTTAATAATEGDGTTEKSNNEETNKGGDNVNNVNNDAPPNQYSVVATFVESTRLMTVKHETENHALCPCTKPDEIDGGANGGATKLICFGKASEVGIHDLSWSNQDTRHVLTAHNDGTVRLWDLREIVYLDVHTGKEVDELLLNQMRQQQEQLQQDGSVSASTTTNTSTSGNSFTISGSGNLVESAKCIMTVNVNITNEPEGSKDIEVRGCMFLPSYEDASHNLQPGGKTSLEPGVCNITSPFITVTKRGSCVTLWSPFTTSGRKPTPVRTFQLGNGGGSDPAAAADYNVSLCTAPNNAAVVAATTNPSSPSPLPSSFVLFADKTRSNIFALHLNSFWCTAPASTSSVDTSLLSSPPLSSASAAPSVAVVNGFDYIIPLHVTQPVYSWSTLVSTIPSFGEDDENEWKIDLFCVQSKAVQLLTLTKAMLLGNSKSLSLGESDNLPEGLVVEDIVIPSAVLVQHIISDDDDDKDDDDDDVAISFEEEEYDVEQDDEDGIEYDEYDDEDIDYNEEEIQDEDTDESEEQKDIGNGVMNESQGPKEMFKDVPTPPMPNFFSGGNDSNPSSFTNWLGNLAGVSTSADVSKETQKKAAIVPPTPQVTPAPAPKVTVDVDLSTVPLPAIPDVEMTDTPKGKIPTVGAVEEAITLEKPKPTQRYLSPVDILASAKKETKKDSTTPPRNDTTINVKGQPKSDKKESKRKSAQKTKNAQPVPGKIAILKRADVAAKKVTTEKPTIALPTSTAAIASTSTVGVTKEEVEDIVRRAVSGHFQKQESIITAEIQKAVRYEVQSGLVPTLNKTVAQTLEQTISKTMKSTVSKSVKEATKINTNELATDLASKLKDPLVDSFYKSMRELMIPAFESGTRQMFDQISSSIERGLDLKENDKSGEENAKALEDVMKRMEAMSKTMEVLIQGVAKVAVGGNRASQTSIASASPAVDKIALLKGKIRDLLGAEEFEKAFTTALSAENPDIAVWACKSADLSIILESETPKLSQPIMLCLMQQLGADFSPQKDNDLKMKLAWLQSIALTLDPYNDSIKKHLVSVCQQLISNLQAKIAEPYVMLRREMQMLVQVIRGIGRS